MILLGGMVKATEARELELVEEEATGVQLVETAESLAARLAQMPVLQFKRQKRLFRRVLICHFRTDANLSRNCSVNFLRLAIRKKVCWNSFRCENRYLQVNNENS